MRLYLKNFLTLLRRYTASSVLNILGMGVAFAAVYLIAVQVGHDLSFNRRIPAADRIYRLEHPSWYDEGRRAMNWDRQLPHALCREIPEIECFGVLSLAGDPGDFSIKRRHAIDNFTLNLTRCERTALELLDVRSTAGSLDELVGTDRLLLAASTARRLGLEVGDRLHVGKGAEQEEQLTVVAIYRDFVSPCAFDAIDGITLLPSAGQEASNHWHSNFYLRLTEGSAPETVGDKLRELLRSRLAESCSPEELERQMRLLAPTLNPLATLYFDPDVEGIDSPTGNRTTTCTLLAIAVLILAVAFINFINFFLALIPARIRAINTCKIFGASRATLCTSLVFETVGLVVAAVYVAFALVVLFADSPLAASLSTTVSLAANLRTALCSIAAAVALAVVAGICAARYLTRFPPAFVLKGSFRATGAGRRLRYALVGVQYVIALVLIIATLFIERQHRFMMQYEMGFDREQLYGITLPEKSVANSERREALVELLRQRPEVAAVSAAEGDLVAPQRNGWGYTDPETGRLNLFNTHRVSWDHLAVLGIEIVDGRDFTPADEVGEGMTFIINETAARRFGLTAGNALTRSSGALLPIVGICRDFHFKPMQYDLEPFAFTVSSAPKPVLNHLYIRMRAGVTGAAARSCIRKVVQRFDPAIELERIAPHFIDEELEENYRQEEQLSVLVLLFSLLAILIAVMGVFGLVLFETQYRRREIGIRRVNGATAGEILLLFNRRFLLVIAACSVVGIPVGYAVVDRWLSQFAYRTPMTGRIFAAAVVLLLVVTVTTVTARSWHAANENPSHVMKAN